MIISKAEKLTRGQLAALAGTPYSTMNKLFGGLNASMRTTTLQKIAGIPQFQKYLLWLLTDKTDPKNGQISPIK